MALIPEHLIDQVRDIANIVDVIGRYVNLRKRGQNYLGLCPFHQEKTPSFSVNPQKQIFRCFGCGVGGNVFVFLMQHEKLTFVDAVKRLAEENGIVIPVSREFKKHVSQTERLLKANQIAQSFYQKQLHDAPKAVIEYLNVRGIKKSIIELYKIGYAPNSWDELLKYLHKIKAPMEAYKKIGLTMENEKSKKTYDRFRHRLMFPIHDQSGKVVAFGGRALEKDPKIAKYINSPESPVYYKSKVLYGLYTAREAIRELSAALFVEGYMDVIQLFQSGIKNVVATSGTALTEDHARLIRRYTNKVYLCYDADNAGINAASRGGEVLFQHNLDTEILILPEGEDPDSYVKTHGKEAFLKLLKETQDYLSFRLWLLKKKYDWQSASGRSQVVSEIIDLLAPMQDSVRSGFYIEKAADKLQLPNTLLMNKLQEKQRQAKKRRLVSSPHELKTQPFQETPLVVTGAWGGEKDVILLLINYYSDIHDYVYSHLQENDFLNSEFRALFRLIKSHEKSSTGNLLHLILENCESENLRSLIIREIEHANAEFSKPALYLQGCIKQIKIARYKAELEVIGRKIQDISSSGELYTATLEEMQRVTVELQNWKEVVISEE